MAEGGGPQPSCGFQRSRRDVGLLRPPQDPTTAGLAEYVNVPATIGAVISAKPELAAALHETLGLEDLWDILEVVEIDAFNDSLVADRRRRQED